MSFTAKSQGTGYEPGYFLAHEECTRETRTVPVTMSAAVTGDDGSKHVPMGTIYPSNDENAEGIIYEDVDVTFGSMPGSVVTKGEVYTKRVPVTIAGGALTALTGKGFVFKDEPDVTRPDFD